MQGQVLELTPSNPTQAMASLGAARTSGKLPVEEIALYGAQIHIVAPQVDQYIPTIEGILQAEGVSAGRVSVIAPSLEDVFISCIRQDDDA